MSITTAILRKALDVWKHPGFSGATSFPQLVWQGLPYLLDSSGQGRAPLTIYWNVNSVCNLHCKMCDVGTFNEESNFFQILRIDRKLHEITVDRFKSVTDELAPYRPMMSIIATEPLMYDPLGEVVAYARSRGLEVAVTTGAYNLPQRAEELAQAGLTRLNVSLDGPPHQHNEIRGRPNVFERAVDGIAKFKEAAGRRGYNPEVLAVYTISNLNYSCLDEFVESLTGIPVDRINFNYMTFVTVELAAAHNALWGAKYKATEMCLSEEVDPQKVDVEVLFSQIQKVKSRKDPRVVFLPDYDVDQLHRYFERPAEFMGDAPCMSTWYFMQILANGECMPFTRCYQVPFGNINTDSFMSIWNGEKARAWRRDLKQHKRFPACTRCPLVV